MSVQSKRVHSVPMVMKPGSTSSPDNPGRVVGEKLHRRLKASGHPDDALAMLRLMKETKIHD